MEYRSLGRTGVSGSQLCLGAMMFGAVGNPDRDESIRRGRDHTQPDGGRVRHPVTSTIIGPRTMEHLDGYLAAEEVNLSTDLLDRIDEIVPPGVTIDVADNMWDIGTAALGASSRRR